MEFSQTLMPRFDESWIAQCETVVTNSGGKFPHIIHDPYPGETTYAYPSVVDEENQAAMEAYLRCHHSDMVSRFAVLRYLRAASLASVPSDGGWASTADGGFIKVDDDEGDAANEALWASALKVLADFADRLAPESIATAEQAQWEFKQAFLMFRWERVMRLAHWYARLAGLSTDDLNLLLGRALWLPNSHFWADLVKTWVTSDETEDVLWERFLDGDPLHVSIQAFFTHAESHPAAISEGAVLDAVASFRKVRPEVMGAHWGILADCYAMTHEPGACAELWEEHGVKVLTALADSVGRSAAEILSATEFQLQMADLWATAHRPQKEIEVLESLRTSAPRLQGINRRLADCYIRAGDLNAATERIKDEAHCDKAFSEDPIVRLLLRQCGSAEEADRQLKEAREKYENSSVSGGQRSAIGNVLQLVWKPFAGLSSSVKEDWIKGLHWCYGEHPSSFDETERAEEAVFRCSRALEVHLRETLFEPLRQAVTPTEVQLLHNAFGPLRAFLEKRSTVTLAVMLDAVASAGPTVPGVIKRLWDLLAKKSAKPHEFRGKKYLDITPIRNRDMHESRPTVSLVTMEEARRCIELCTEFLTLLETPPPLLRPGLPPSASQRR